MSSVILHAIDLQSLTGVVLRSIAEKRVARVDFPAKNLKSYFRGKILRKKVQEDRLRMTIRGFA